MLNQGDYQAAFGRPDPAFTRRMRQTVFELTLREEPVVRRKLRVSLLVSVFIAILLAAIAFAAAQKWDIIDFFRFADQPIEPLKSAEHMVANNLGSAENGRLCITVREAVYDGLYVRAVVEIAPAEGAGLMLVDPWGDPDVPLSKVVQDMAESLGKTAYFVDYPAIRETTGVELVSADPHEVDMAGPPSERYALESDAIAFNLAYAVSEGSPDALSLELNMRAPDDDLAVPFRLTKTGDALVFKLIPDKTSIPDAGFELNSATIRLTPLAGVLDVLWTQSVIEPVALGGESSIYVTKNGKYFHRRSDCAGMTNARLATVREAKADGRLQCPYCLIGKPRKADLTFELLDENGDLIDIIDTWSRPLTIENGGQAIRTVGIFQPSEKAHSVYSLRPVDSFTAERFEPLRCTIAKE